MQSNTIHISALQILLSNPWPPWSRGVTTLAHFLYCLSHAVSLQIKSFVRAWAESPNSPWRGKRIWDQHYFFLSQKPPQEMVWLCQLWCDRGDRSNDTTKPWESFLRASLVPSWHIVYKQDVSSRISVSQSCPGWTSLRAPQLNSPLPAQIWVGSAGSKLTCSSGMPGALSLVVLEKSFF